MTWRERARALELRQRTIAALLGRTEQWVSRHMEDQISVRLVIPSWELRDPGERARLRAQKEPVSKDRPKSSRPLGGRPLPPVAATGPSPTRRRWRSVTVPRRASRTGARLVRGRCGSRRIDVVVSGS
jgi:hypothetical protein